MEPIFYTAKYLGSNILSRHKDVYALPRRTIPYLDLTYCLDGRMEYIYKDEHVILRPGDAILFPQGSIRQRLYTNTPTYYASINVQFPESFEPKVEGYLPRCVRSNTALMLETFSRDYDSVSPRKQEKCADIFSYLYHQLLETVLDKENPHIKSIKQYIFSNLSKPLTLTEIADAVHLAPTYLCNLFKKETGETVVEYITTQKVDFAKRLMIVKDLPLYDIAERCGFGDYKHFSHTFKRVVGISPMQYRKAKQIVE